MKLIGAALQRLVDDGTRVTAEFRIERAGDHIDFSQRIGIHSNAGLVQEKVVDVGSIQQIGILLGLTAVG